MPSEEKRKAKEVYFDPTPTKHRPDGTSLVIHGTAPRARPPKAWPPDKPPGGKIEVRKLPDGRISYKPIDD